MVFLIVMLIKVSKEIVVSATHEDSDNHFVAFFLLQELSIAVRYGHHIVYIPCLEQMEINSELKRMMPKEYPFLRRALSERIKLGIILQKVRIGVNCSFSNPKESQETIKWIWINPLVWQNFRWYDETLVIAEHLNDIQLFKSILLYWKKCNSLKGVNTAMSCTMGGGATTSKVVEHVYELRQHFVVVIADSDKNFPTDKEGETAKSIRKCLDNLCIGFGKDLCKLYVLQNVRECENLIPISLMESVKVKKENIEKIKRMDSSFYDMKCGLSCNVLCDEDSLVYWKGILSDESFDLVTSCRERKKKKQPCLKKKNTVVQYCLGSGVLDDLLNDYQNHSGLDQIKQSDLTRAQEYEWNSIGQLLFEWTCGFKESRS